MCLTIFECFRMILVEKVEEGREGRRRLMKVEEGRRRLKRVEEGRRGLKKVEEG